MASRFFPITAMAGKIYTDGFGERGPWDTKLLAFQDEATVEVFVTKVSHRKVMTAEGLQALLRESEESSPAIRAWISEGLKGFARGLWEEYRR